MTNDQGDELVMVPVRRQYVDAASAMVRAVAGPDAKPTPQYAIESAIAALVNEFAMIAAEAEGRGATLQ